MDDLGAAGGDGAVRHVRGADAVWSAEVAGGFADARRRVDQHIAGPRGRDSRTAVRGDAGPQRRARAAEVGTGRD